MIADTALLCNNNSLVPTNPLTVASFYSLYFTPANFFAEAAHRRQKRDTNNDLKLESVLMEDPTGAHLVEFDLILDDDQFGTVKSIGEVKTNKPNRQKRKAVRHSIYHWPGAVVPYEIHSSAGKSHSLM